MKKTLIAVAALSAMAASAMAADVTVYGVLDTGVGFTSVKSAKTGDKDRTVKMMSGLNSGPRWGFKGTEDLGSVKVGFVLEGGFYDDDGKLGDADNDKLFNRQCEVNVSGSFGKFAFGRMGTITGGTNGGIMTAKVSGIGTSFGDLKGATSNIFTQLGSSRVDNAVRYDSPVYNGLNAVLQYSDSINGTNEGVRAGSTGYMGAVAQYANGPVYAAASYSQVHEKGAEATNRAYNVLASYDFGVVKAFAGYQYVDDEGNSDKLSNYMVAAQAPVFGGRLAGQVGYSDSDLEKDAFQLACAYYYDFSKRTSVYGVATYYTKENATYAGRKDKTYGLGFGLVHKF